MQDYTDRYSNRYARIGNPPPAAIPGYSKDEFMRQQNNAQSQQESGKFPYGDSNAHSDITSKHKDPSPPSYLGTPSNGVCVKNLALEVTEAMLWEEMMNDRLKGVRIITDKDTKRPRGFAFLTFPSIVDATNILTKYPASSGLGHDHPLVLCGQRCLLEYTTTAGEVRYDKKSDWVCEQ
ncbi:hypothetical protein WA577_002459, partial [Blastocystis sp. JDR]